MAFIFLGGEDEGDLSIDSATTSSKSVFDLYSSAVSTDLRFPKVRSTQGITYVYKILECM